MNHDCDTKHNSERTQYYKVINRDLNHEGQCYHLGLVTMTHDTWDPLSGDDGGGLFISKYPEHWLNFGCYLAFVEIPVDAQVCVLNVFETKVDKLVITKILLIRDCQWLDWPMALQRDPSMVKWMANPTYQQCLDAVMSRGLSLKHIPLKFQTVELRLAALKSNGRALRYIPEEEQTLEMCNIAIGSNGHAIQHVSVRFKDLYLCAKAFLKRCQEINPPRVWCCQSLFDMLHKRWLEWKFNANIIDVY